MLSRVVRQAARARVPFRHFSAAADPDKNLVLYEAERSTGSRLCRHSLSCKLAGGGSQAGLDMWSLLEGKSTLGIGGTEIFALAPELVLCGAAGSVAFLALVKFYASKLVGRVELSPEHDKVTVSTHTMFGSLLPRTFSVAGITRPTPAHNLLPLQSRE